MQRYVGFCSDDAAALRSLLPLVEPRLSWLADRFYSHIDQHPEAAAVLKDEAQRVRLHGTLQRWVRELLTGPHDEAYWAQRLRIGTTHVRVGLPQRFMFTAMSRLRMDLSLLARESMPGEQAWEACAAIQRVTDIELAVMLQSYMGAHEDLRLRDLQSAIVESLPVTALCVDKAGEVIVSTRASTRVFGAAKEGASQLEAYLPEELIRRGRVRSNLERAIRAEREVTVPRVAVGDGADGRVFRVTIVPLGHELADALVHVEELTDVIQAEARAQQAETLARIGSLAANMAHEIRNPLAAISATLQVITRTLGDDDRRRVILGKVQEQVHRLDRLVSDLLGYARPTQAKLEPVVLVEVAREAIAQSGVDAELIADAEEVAVADRQLCQHVLMNLLQNARDAAGPGASVQLRLCEGGRVCVEDGGPGVPPEMREQVFEAFVTTKTRGTGLGLAICRKMCEAMGAALTLDAEPSPLGGARFVLSLRLETTD
ncbi:MAG: hypothetical protein H6740_10910 [Alphaproteobacteria bacterium]|nr:hypothetical protein [Alphaproteobacteria bacterium]